MQFIFHADDYGLTRGITDRILMAFDRGALSSTSIIANGDAFDYAIDQYHARPGLQLSVHLNLVESRPLAERERVKLLLDDDGQLNNDFISLWLRHTFSTPAGKRRLEEAVAAEFSAQLGRVHARLKQKAPLRVDSHRHLHMVPFVMRVLLDLKKTFPIASIRLPREPFIIDSFSELIRSGSHLIAHFLLNRLSKRAAPKLRATGIAFAEHFLGVLFTGQMTRAVVAAARSKMSVATEGTCEVLFHPGKAKPEEWELWKYRPDLMAYYYSNGRDTELQQLLEIVEENYASVSRRG